MRKKHGLGEALSPDARQAVTERSDDLVIAAITQLLDAAQRDGTIRADAHPGDFLQLADALWRAASGPDDRSQPMLGLILDGLSAHPPARRTAPGRPARTDPPGVPAQHSVLGPEHQQLSILGHVPARHQDREAQ